MEVPLQITFHEIDHSDAVEERIRERVDKLEKYYNNIVSCRVTVEKPHRHQHQGQLFDIRIDLSVPGHEFLIHSDKGKNHAHEDVNIAIRDAFDSLQRQLKDHSEKNRRAQRAHREAQR